MISHFAIPTSFPKNSLIRNDHPADAIWQQSCRERYDGVTLITINDAIAALRRELAIAVAAAAKQPDGGMLMTVEEAHVELQVTLTTEVKGTAEVNVWVLKLGGQGGGSSADSHKVTVILKPRALDGGPIRVASQGPALPTPLPRGK